MFKARTEDCADPANTSTGAGDVRPWPDGCMEWHTPFATDSQRPVTWSQGEFNSATCRYENMKVWSSTHNSGTTVATVYRVDGDTGMIEDQVDVQGVQTHVFGLYGAAVDADGNMWASELSSGILVNVDLETMAVRTWPMAAPGYGMTVDSDGFVWTCSSTVARFDPMTETWQTSAALSSSGNGCMEDGNGTLWVAADGFVGIDTTTLMETGTLALPARVRGVSFDFEGYIWGPSINSNEAYRVDPATGATDTVTGFNYPYTYSDMTGFALSNAGTPSG
jgi:streptogramin lyase